MNKRRPAPRVRVAAGLFRRNDQVLVQQRPVGKTRALLWEFPGGKIEHGESDEAALVRECQEELGVTVQVAEELWRTVHSYEDLVVELVIFNASLPKDVEPQALEAHRLAWIDRRGLARLEFCAADEVFVRYLRAGKLPS